MLITTTSVRAAMIYVMVVIESTEYIHEVNFATRDLLLANGLWFLRAYRSHRTCFVLVKTPSHHHFLVLENNHANVVHWNPTRLSLNLNCMLWVYLDSLHMVLDLRVTIFSGDHNTFNFNSHLLQGSRWNMHNILLPRSMIMDVSSFVRFVLACYASRCSLSLNSPHVGLLWWGTCFYTTL